MYGHTFPVNANCGKAISLVAGQLAFQPSGTGLSRMSTERSNFIESPGHSTKTVIVDWVMSKERSNSAGTQGYSTKRCDSRSAHLGLPCDPFQQRVKFYRISRAFY